MSSKGRFYLVEKIMTMILLVIIFYILSSVLLYLYLIIYVLVPFINHQVFRILRSILLQHLLEVPW